MKKQYIPIFHFPMLAGVLFIFDTPQKAKLSIFPFNYFPCISFIMPLPIGQNYQQVIKRIDKLPEFLSPPLSRHKDTPCPPHTEKVYAINQRKKINIKKIWNEHHPIFQTMVPIPKDVPSIGQIKRQTAEENFINHEEWFSWEKRVKKGKPW